MMENNKIITNDTGIIERLDAYQAEITRLSIAPLHIHNFEDRSNARHYQIAISVFKNWLSDLYDVIDEDEKRIATKWMDMAELLSQAEITTSSYSEGYGVTKFFPNVNTKNCELMKKIYFQLQCDLKKLTNKYYSDKPKTVRLRK